MGVYIDKYQVGDRDFDNAACALRAIRQDSDIVSRCNCRKYCYTIELFYACVHPRELRWTEEFFQTLSLPL